MFKLMLLLYLFGQDGGRYRFYSLFGLAIAIYLWQMDYLRFVRRVIETALPDPRTLINRLFPAARRADNDGTTDATNGGS